MLQKQRVLLCIWLQSAYDQDGPYEELDFDFCAAYMLSHIILRLSSMRKEVSSSSGMKG